MEEGNEKAAAAFAKRLQTTLSQSTGRSAEAISNRDNDLIGKSTKFLSELAHAATNATGDVWSVRCSKPTIMTGNNTSLFKALYERDDGASKLVQVQITDNFIETTVGGEAFTARKRSEWQEALSDAVHHAISST